jgi:hypothetical protein
MNLRFAFLSLSFATLAACGGDSPGTGPVSAADAEDGCRAGCQRDFDCDPTSATPVEQCTTSCVAEVSGWVRADAFADITDCIADLACTASEDTCVDQCDPTDAHEAYEAQCREVFAPCSADPADINGICETTPSGSGDVGFFCLITPSVMDQLTACIPDGTACQAGIDCIQGVLETNGIDG